MSISVDDLVSSLSSSHIGQEAIDLAALQTQLAQTLFGQPISSSSSSSARQVPRGSKHIQPCNTPTGRTPSSSFSWAQAASSSSSSSNSYWRGADDNISRNSTAEDMEEDERMVEELLMPSSPVPMSVATTPSSTNFSFAQQQQSQHYPSSSISPLPSPYPYSPEPSSSQFASTDPFFIAQVQASQDYSSPQSVFSQAGRPSQASPFMLKQQPQPLSSAQAYPIPYRENHGYIHPNALDTHSMFVRTGAAF